MHGTLDFSGGYVIHLAAGVSGFVAAAVVGPRLQRDREVDAPNNLAMVAVGAGLLWLGWNGFNGGDPYLANADASAAVLNTNLCTAVAFLSWVGLDYATGRKPSLIGSVNGMITGLVAITPAAGFVNGWGAMAIGVIGGDHRLPGAQLPEPHVALPARRRHPRRGLHPRVRGCCRRPVDRHLRQLEDGNGIRGLRGGSDLGWRVQPPEVAVPRRCVGDRVLRGRDLHPPEAGRRVRPATDERGGHGRPGTSQSTATRSTPRTSRHWAASRDRAPGRRPQGPR